MPRERGLGSELWASMWNSNLGGLPFSLVLAGFDVLYSFGSLGSFNSLFGLLFKSLLSLELVLSLKVTLGLKLVLVFGFVFCLLKVTLWFFFTRGDVNVLFATVLLRSVLGDADVLFVDLLAFAFRGSGGVTGFRVTFPSFLKFDLTLYFGGLGFFCGSDGSVTPVRGREDTERNCGRGLVSNCSTVLIWSEGEVEVNVRTRYPGVEVQIAGGGSFLLRQERTSWLLCGRPKKMVVDVEVAVKFSSSDEEVESTTCWKAIGGAGQSIGKWAMVREGKAEEGCKVVFKRGGWRVVFKTSQTG